MCKKIIEGLVDNPIVSSVFAVDFLLLLFIRPPFLFSFLMLATLAGCGMYLGQKAQLFK